MPLELKRKILEHGEHSGCVTIPKGWLEFHNLKKGEDAVKVFVNSMIIIVPENKQELVGQLKEVFGSSLDSGEGMDRLKKLMEEEQNGERHGE